jgi:hypothetical protein
MIINKKQKFRLTERLNNQPGEIENIKDFRIQLNSSTLQVQEQPMKKNSLKGNKMVFSKREQKLIFFSSYSKDNFFSNSASTI